MKLLTPPQRLVQIPFILRASPVACLNARKPGFASTKLTHRAVMHTESGAEDYSKWPHADLVERVRQLESTIQKYARIAGPPPSPLPAPDPVADPPRVTSPKPSRKRKHLDPSRYSTRLIALKIAYLGKNYNGFEYHANNTTPLPTIEEKIFGALLKARLVNPAVDPECAVVASDNPTAAGDNSIGLWPGDDIVSYSKCGRTDRGVSAFGQVIAVRVRSNRPIAAKKQSTPQDEQEQVEDVNIDNQDLETPPFDDVKDELPYVQILNRLLPNDIQVLAWCPNPPEVFSARHNCRARHYRYFFTNPAIPPIVNTDETTASEGWLDIEKMREAASYFLGENDFRNFCKIDASKQITNFKRFIYHSDIEEYNPLPPTCYANPTTTITSETNTLPPAPSSSPKIYFFHLQGTAFLWHQVRHMVALLFLVGQGLEPPTLIKSLLDTASNPRKPNYEMADDKPLVLWDCVFPEEMIQWVYGENCEHRGRRDGLVDSVWENWHGARIEEVLAGGLVDLVDKARREYSSATTTTSAIIMAATSKKDPPLTPSLPHSNTFGNPPPQAPVRPTTYAPSQILINGGDKVLLRGKYIPVLERNRMEEPEVLNKRYQERKPEKYGQMGKKGRARKKREEEERLLTENGEREGRGERLSD